MKVKLRAHYDREKTVYVVPREGKISYRAYRDAGRRARLSGGDYLVYAEPIAEYITIVGGHGQAVGYIG